MEQAVASKRTLHNIRQAFEGSPWIRRAALRYMLQKTNHEERCALDAKIGSRLPLVEDRHNGSFEEKRALDHIRWLIDQAPDVQGEALKCLARRIGTEGLRKLDQNIAKLRKNPDKFRI